ncbi:pre-mRNA-splicing factor ATP-dependent RNA helicase PRP2 [Culex quinquefasciatus]|uniref:RNA helicase n=1 Tax=Culex quinquefasciatus TaxID=7176 RepID=B0XKY1_CULQU|nr:pre-mRNA-splicing factor ATP-dependent RNA helicase PRP2 [Culex quinquefasciatus]|eukprot:XP_001870303.1 pre-mRNA-splicing factor ATP-dependent RNA helicase PRP2 [Culex quinquefasciatus]
MIGITQPRRVAAITVAKRVAQEQECSVGDVVGYAVRFEDATSANTQIKYLTDGILFREALSDQLLKKYNIIVLDEAHERTIATDVLFGIVKKAQQTRRKMLVPLKVIVMSATMDVDHFSQYFNKCPVMHLQGSNFKVKVYQSMDNTNYLEAVITTIFQIHENCNDDGDILVFLTGQEEIEAATALVRRLAKAINHRDLPRMLVVPMYGAMSQNSQQDPFALAPPFTRKVVLATNIAETSITIPAIKYVVDSGKVKVRTFDPVTGIDSLKVTWISRAQAWQRTGRAGRTADGECYRTYSKEDFKAMAATSTPEILRCSVVSSTLQLLALGINCRDFDFLDKPPADALTSAMQELKALGAIMSVDQPALTTLGRKMSKLPLDPKYAKILLSATDYGCLEEALTIVAMLSGENVFYNTSQKREQVLTAHAKFHAKCGDHVTLLNVFNEFKTKDEPKRWCHDNFLLERNLSHAAAVRTQLANICRSLGLPPTSCGNDPVPIVKCLLTGLYRNIAELQRDNSYLTLANRTRCRIHPASVIHGRARPGYLLFTELVSTGTNYLRTISEIEPEWVGEVVPHCTFLDRITCGGNRGSSSCYKAGYLVAVSAALDLIGRLTLGWLSDLDLFDRKKAYIVCILGAGTAVLTIASSDAWIVIAVSAGCYGLCLGSWYLLMPVLLADLFGTDRISSSYGLVRMFQSIGAISVPPLAGF